MTCFKEVCDIYVSLDRMWSFVVQYVDDNNDNMVDKEDILVWLVRK